MDHEANKLEPCAKTSVVLYNNVSRCVMQHLEHFQKIGCVFVFTNPGKIINILNVVCHKGHVSCLKALFCVNFFGLANVAGNAVCGFIKKFSTTRVVLYAETEVVEEEWDTGSDHNEVLEAVLNNATVNHSATTPLMNAVWANNVEVCKVLVQRGSDVSACDTDGFSALHCAVSGRSHGALDVLLENNIDLNTTHVDYTVYKDLHPCPSNTPLHEAIFSGDVDLVIRLLSLGACIHERSASGRTVLHQVAVFCTGNRERMVRVLLNKGAALCVRAGWVGRKAVRGNDIFCSLRTHPTSTSLDDMLDRWVALCRFYSNQLISMDSRISDVRRAAVLLFAAGDSVTFVRAIDEYPDEVIEPTNDAVHTLKGICRFRIRFTLIERYPSQCLIPFVRLLPLPKTLKEFLLYGVNLD